jgi:hypothetical protein
MARRSDRLSVLWLILLPLCGAATAQKPTPADDPKALGALDNDLVYTPITACRIVNTEATAAGPIAAGATRSFSGIAEASYAAQGGSATDCGTAGVVATALMLHVTAVTPTLAGNATVYPFNTTRPASPSLQYSAGAVVNGAVLAQIPNPPQASDFTIHSSATANYTVDIVGYFAPPQATALQCVQSGLASVDIPAGGAATVFSPSCPAGYAKISNGCDTTSTLAYLTISAIGGCQARNTSASLQQLTAQATCCRVPGR